MGYFKVATWNVNSVRARLEVVERWLLQEDPHVVLLQETKCQEKDFPFSFFYEKGYQCYVWGEKSYNGVAILSKLPLEACVGPSWAPNNPWGARYAEAVVARTRFVSVYVPNGRHVDSSHYLEKKSFFDCLAERLRYLRTLPEPLIVGGDYNVAFTSCDVANPSHWHEKILCSTQERRWLSQLKQAGSWQKEGSCGTWPQKTCAQGTPQQTPHKHISSPHTSPQGPVCPGVGYQGGCCGEGVEKGGQGEHVQGEHLQKEPLQGEGAQKALGPCNPLVGAPKNKNWQRPILQHPKELQDPGALFVPPSGEKNAFTWWDYRTIKRGPSNGLRIDYLLVDPTLYPLMAHYYVDTPVRFWPRTSDHAPVVGVFSCSPQDFLQSPPKNYPKDHQKDPRS